MEKPEWLKLFDQYSETRDEEDLKAAADEIQSWMKHTDCWWIQLKTINDEVQDPELNTFIAEQLQDFRQDCCESEGLDYGICPMTLMPINPQLDLVSRAYLGVGHCEYPSWDGLEAEWYKRFSHAIEEHYDLVDDLRSAFETEPEERVALVLSAGDHHHPEFLDIAKSVKTGDFTFSDCSSGTTYFDDGGLKKELEEVFTNTITFLETAAKVTQKDPTQVEELLSKLRTILHEKPMDSI